MTITVLFRSQDVGVPGPLPDRSPNRGLPLLHEELWQVQGAWHLRACPSLSTGMLRDEQGDDGQGWRFR